MVVVVPLKNKSFSIQINCFIYWK